MANDFIIKIIPKDESPEISAAMRGTPFSRASKKHKTTFVIETIQYLNDDSIFKTDILNKTCLTMGILNGHKLRNNIYKIHKSFFPNPGATALIKNFDILAPVMGAKMAATIIEYNDTVNDDPVVTLYPDGSIHIEEPYNLFTYRKFLNHATRRDLKYQRNLRQQFMSQIKSMEK